MSVSALLQETIRVAIRSALLGDGASLPAHVVDLYLADLETRCCAKHVTGTRRVLRAVLAACPTLLAASLLAYRARRLREGVSNRTANYEIRSLRTFLRWAKEDAELLPATFQVPKIRPLPQREANRVRIRRALTEEEIAAFLAAALKIDQRRALLRGPAARAQLPLWRTLVEVGLRWGEATKLERKDLQGEEIVLPPRITKGRRSRRIPIQPDLAAALKEHARGKDRPLFPTPKGKSWRENSHRNASRNFAMILKASGIRKTDDEGRVVDIHALRYTACTRMLRRGVPPAVVARVLGHKDPSLTLKVYTDLNDSIDVAEALKKSWEQPPPA